jgi:hypothetical protein
MTISSLSRTERTADLRRIFKACRDLNQSELDSHADTCVAGANTRVMDYTDTKVSVSPFSDSYKAIKDAPIVMVATAGDDPATGVVTVLYINEALFLGTGRATHYSARNNFAPMDGKSRMCRNSSTRSRLLLSSTLQAPFGCP